MSVGPRDGASWVLCGRDVAGVRHAHKEGRSTFTFLVRWPGELMCAEGIL